MIQGKGSIRDKLFTRCLRTVFAFGACVCTFAAPGCNSFGNAKLVQELRSENERLLTEFRSERDRREESEKALAQIESRLAESEKLLARQYQQPASRLSSLPGFGEKGDLNSATNDGLADQDPQETGNLQWQRRGRQ